MITVKDMEGVIHSFDNAHFITWKHKGEWVRIENKDRELIALFRSPMWIKTDAS